MLGFVNMIMLDIWTSFFDSQILSKVLYFSS